jgi:hypothetical protein
MKVLGIFQLSLPLEVMMSVVSSVCWMVGYLSMIVIHWDAPFCTWLQHAGMKMPFEFWWKGMVMWMWETRTKSHLSTWPLPLETNKQCSF